MQAWILKFLGGLIPWVSKPFSEWFGKILFYGLLFFVFTTAWNKFIEPKNVTKVERVETQIINECPVEHPFLGVKLNIWKLKLGVGI